MSGVADRMRAYRTRLKAGMIVVTACVDQLALECALIEAELLDPFINDDDRAAYQEAINRALTALINSFILEYADPDAIANDFNERNTE